MSAAKAIAGQLVYTRVEPTYSPRARAGYQVVWVEPSLAANVVAEIEARVRCFVPTAGRQRRLQFSPLRAGGFFAARTLQMPANSAVCDRDGRPVFLAHAVWLDERQLATLGCHPFAVLAALPDGTVEDLVAAFGRATGVAPLLEIAAGGSGDTAEATGAEQAAALSLAGLVVARAGGRPTAPTFLRGPSAEVENVLRVALALLPPCLRRGCSFDTHVDGCSPGDYLLLAGERQPAAPSVEVRDLGGEAGALTGELAATYVGWLERALAAGSPATVAMQTVTAYETCLALCGQPAAAAPTELDREVCRQVLAYEGERLRARLASRFRRRLRRNGIEQCCQWLLGELIQAAPERLVAGLKEG